MNKQSFAVLLLSVAFGLSMFGCQTTKQCPMHKQAAKCPSKCTMNCGDKCSSMCGTKCGQ